MAIPAALLILPVGILFVISGLIVNLVQVIIFVLLRPLAKTWHRRINKLIAESLWLELIGLVDWWAGLKVELHTDSETYNQFMGKENAIIISNHRSDIDWLVGWVLAQRVGCLGSTIAMMKKELKYLPIIGWSMWFTEYVFVERSWEKDQTTLNKRFQDLESFPIPFWLALFVEGTRFTDAKLHVAQEFASSRGLPIPRNVLIPRTKGFVSAILRMRTSIPAIYDCTFAIPRSQPSPTLLRMFRGISSSIKVEIKRHNMEELPETADGIAQWCKDIFVTKDAALERYRTSDMFSEQEIQELGRPKTSLFVVILWSCFVVLLIVKLFQSSSLLSLWEGIVIAALFLILVTVLMEIIVRSSVSENSTPMKLLTKDPAKERLLLK